MTMRLIIAAANNQIALVGQCLRVGDNVNDQDNLYGQTALHCALKSKHYDVASLLLSYGADSTIKDSGGFTARDVYNGTYEKAMDDMFAQRLEDEDTTSLSGDNYLNDHYGSDIY